MNEIQNTKLEPFKVCVRIRPFLPKEIPNYNNENQEKNIIPRSIFSHKDNILTVQDLRFEIRNEKVFFFDQIFDEENNNKDVFDKSIKPMIDNLIEGYNSTILAYGITGTGKTHTIFGDYNDENTEKGIVINAINYLFNQINFLKEKNENEKNYIVKVSYLEIYNETVIDLLNKKNYSLMIVEDINKGIYVPDLKEFIINSSLELENLINEGNKKRTMAPTNQNQFSSRSHAILQINLIQTEKIKKNNINKEEIKFSKFLLVDLAGSERGGIEKGKRREEGSNINKSLLSLGNCINILSDPSKVGNFVPYRDSKLTRLLKDSLGGNIVTLMMACVSPSQKFYDESINTLNYASKAKKIKKKIFKNVKFNYESNNDNFNEYNEIIENLKEEILNLKEIIKNQENKLKEKEKQNKSNFLNDDDYLNEDISSIKPVNNNEEGFLDLDENFNENNSFLSEIKNSESNREKNNDYNKKTVQTMNVDLYKKYLEDDLNKDINTNINNIQKQVENIKKDRIILESFMETQSIKDDIITAKYSSLKNYYDKYIELINDKLIENIEQNMILKCNLKEINNLNLENESNLEMLHKQLSYIDQQSTSPSREYLKITDEMENIKNSIKENNDLKTQIYESFSRNMKIKRILKKILLTLLTSTKDNSEKYISILKEREELKGIAKTYEKQIKQIIFEKRKKDFEVTQAQKEVESLKKLLKEKDETIRQLKNASINESILGNYNLNNSINNNNQKLSKTNYKRKNSTPIFTKQNSMIINNDPQIFRNYISNSKQKIKSNKSNSNISYIFYNNKQFISRAHDRCKSNKMNNDSNISYTLYKNKYDNSYLKKINMTVQKEKSLNSIFDKQKAKTPIINNINNINNNNINNNNNNNSNNRNKKNKNRISPLTLSKDLSNSIQTKTNFNITSNNNITTETKNDITSSLNKDLDILSEINNITRIKNKNYSKYINVTNTSSKKKNSLKIARYENKLKNEKNLELIKAENFLNEYEKSKNDNTIFSNKSKNNFSKIPTEENKTKSMINLNENNKTNNSLISKQINNNRYDSYLNNSNNKKENNSNINDEFFNDIANSIRDRHVDKYLNTINSNK